MNNYITLAEVAEKWNLSSRRVRKLCEDGRIEGAIKFGRNWAIPQNADKPTDKRIKSGRYIKNV